MAFLNLRTKTNCYKNVFFPYNSTATCGRNTCKPALCLRGSFEHEEFARWIDMLPACWDSDTGDKEQGNSLKEMPEACCEWTSIIFQMKHLHIIDSQYQCKHLMHGAACTAENNPEKVWHWTPSPTHFHKFWTIFAPFREWWPRG